MEMLRRSEIPVAGRHAVVIGRSDIVGKPMALMLLHANATVTICHSRTADLPAVAATADILVVAIGRAGFVTPDFVKPGATVIDVGMNTLDRRGDGRGLVPARVAAARRRSPRKGSLLVGDVDPRVAEVAGALTPVPRRRRPADDRDADEQHGRRRRRARARVTLRAARTPNFQRPTSKALPTPNSQILPGSPSARSSWALVVGEWLAELRRSEVGSCRRGAR